MYLFPEGLHEVYLDYEKEEFMLKAYSFITNNLGGRTDKRNYCFNLAFPIDIALGPPGQVYAKLRFGFLLRILLTFLYFYIAFKIRPYINGNLSRLFWPVALLKKLYKDYLNIY